MGKLSNRQRGSFVFESELALSALSSCQDLSGSGTRTSSFAINLAIALPFTFWLFQPALPGRVFGPIRPGVRSHVRARGVPHAMEATPELNYRTL